MATYVHKMFTITNIILYRFDTTTLFKIVFVEHYDSCHGHSSATVRIFYQYYLFIDNCNNSQGTPFRF